MKRRLLIRRREAVEAGARPTCRVPSLCCGAMIVLLPALAPVGFAAGEPSCKVLDSELQDAYDGGCRNGLAYGEGSASGTARYQGEFRNGRKEGHGVKTWPWGDRYEGEFKADRKHGHGIYVWGAGSQWAGERYEGQFVDDLRNGWGVYSWPNGDRYEGSWTKDQRAGYSVFEQRRQQALSAQQTAFQPGVTVCWLPFATRFGQIVKGTVDAFDAGVLQVRLSEVPLGIAAAPGVTLAVGQVLTDNAIDWAPCS